MDTATYNRFPFVVSDGSQVFGGAFTRLVSAGFRHDAIDIAGELAVRDAVTRYVWDCTQFTVLRLVAIANADGTVEVRY